MEAPHRRYNMILDGIVSTVGYGQFHPTTDGARVFTAFYIIVGLLFVLTAVDEFARHFIVEFQRTVVRSLYPQSTKLDQAMKMTISSSIVLFVLMLVGIIFFVNNEKWNSAESFYFTITTMTTVGYGDLTITHESTRIFIIFFICVVLTNYATVIQNVREVQIVTILIRAEKGGAEFMHISDETIRGNDTNPNLTEPGAAGVVNGAEQTYSQIELRKISEEDETYNPFIAKKGGKQEDNLSDSVNVAVCLMQLLLNDTEGSSSSSSSGSDIQRNSVLLMNDLAALKEKYSKSGGRTALRSQMTKQELIDFVVAYSPPFAGTVSRKGVKQRTPLADVDELKSEV